MEAYYSLGEECDIIYILILMIVFHTPISDHGSYEAEVIRREKEGLVR